VLAAAQHAASEEAALRAGHPAQIIAVAGLGALRLAVAALGTGAGAPGGVESIAVDLAGQGAAVEALALTALTGEVVAAAGFGAGDEPVAAHRAVAFAPARIEAAVGRAVQHATVEAAADAGFTRERVAIARFGAVEHAVAAQYAVWRVWVLRYCF